MPVQPTFADEPVLASLPCEEAITETTVQVNMVVKNEYKSIIIRSLSTVSNTHKKVNYSV